MGHLRGSWYGEREGGKREMKELQIVLELQIDWGSGVCFLVRV